MILERATLEDLWSLAPPVPERGSPFAIPAAVELYSQRAFAIRHPSGLLGVVGLLPIMPGIGELWLVFAPAAQRYRLHTIAGLLAADRRSHELLPTHRQQAHVAIGSPTQAQTISLLERWGFAYEGTVRDVPVLGTNQMLYARRTPPPVPRNG